MSDTGRTEAVHDDLVVLAGEIAMGLIRMSDLSPEFRDSRELSNEIDRWNDDLTKLVDELGLVEPPARVWIALEKSVGQRPSSFFRSEWFNSIVFWRWATAAVSILTVIILGLIAATHSQKARTAQETIVLVAAILPKEGPPLFTATYDSGPRIFVVIPAGFQPDPGKTAELWIVPKGSDDPTALGALDAEHPSKISLSLEQSNRIDDGAALVVTSEPVDSGTPDQPGPVIAHGRLTRP
jgi:anti-sigma-K factor RskA